MKNPSNDIDITTMLFLQYKKPVVSLDTIISDYLPHLNEKTARKKASSCNLPFPAFKIDKSSQGKYFVNLSDFAVYLEQEREQAHQDWQAMQS